MKRLFFFSWLKTGETGFEGRFEGETGQKTYYGIFHVTGRVATPFKPTITQGTSPLTLLSVLHLVLPKYNFIEFGTGFSKKRIDNIKA